MKKVYDFLKEAGTYYIATLDGDQPRVRRADQKLSLVIQAMALENLAPNLCFLAKRRSKHCQNGIEQDRREGRKVI